MAIPSGVKQLTGGSWQADVRKSGFPRVRKSFRTMTLASTWRNKVIAAMSDGTYQTDAEVEAEAKEALAANARIPTLRQATVRYLEEITSKKRGGAKTVETETTAFNQILTMPFADNPMTTITTSHIADFVLFLEKRKNAPSTVNRKLTTISHLFVKAKKWHMPELINPVTGNKQGLGAGGRRRSRKFEGGEEEALINAFDGCLNPYIKLIVLFALETGMRRREILESRRINLTKGNRQFLHLPAPITKSDLKRDVPLSPAAMSIIEKAGDMDDNSYVDRDLSKKGFIFPITIKAFEEAWKKTVKRAGLIDFEFRDTRHVALTRLSKIYPRAQDLARISGHEQLDTLLTYYEESIEEQCDMMNAFYK